MAKRPVNKVIHTCNGKIIDIDSPKNQEILRKVVFEIIDKMIEEKLAELAEEDV